MAHNRAEVAWGKGKFWTLSAVSVPVLHFGDPGVLWPGQRWKIHSEAQLGIVLLSISIVSTNKKPPPDHSATTRQGGEKPLGSRRSLVSGSPYSREPGGAVSPTLGKFQSWVQSNNTASVPAPQYPVPQHPAPTLWLGFFGPLTRSCLFSQDLFPWGSKSLLGPHRYYGLSFTHRSLLLAPNENVIT